MISVPITGTLSERYRALMYRLMQLVAGRYVADRSDANLARMNDSQGRLDSLSRRLRGLLARIEAGTVSLWRPRKPGAAGRAREAPARARAAMGRGFGWLVGQEGPGHHEVIWARDNIDRLLNETETLDMLGKAPRPAGRIVRPLCHMLRLQAPEMFRLPPRPRPVPTPKVREAEPVRKIPWGTPRVASANWPRGCVAAGETVPLGRRNRRRDRRQE